MTDEKILQRHMAVEAAYATNWPAVERKNFERRLAESLDWHLEGILDECPSEYLDKLIEGEDIELAYLADTTKRLIMLIELTVSQLNRQ